MEYIIKIIYSEKCVKSEACRLRYMDNRDVEARPVKRSDCIFVEYYGKWGIQSIRKTAFCLLFAIATGAAGSEASPGGSICFSAGTAYSRMTLSYGSGERFLVRASFPLPLDKEKLFDSMSATAVVKAGSCDISMGRIGITHASGFIVSGRSASMLSRTFFSVRSLGLISDPPGITVSAPRWAGFLTKADLGPVAGIQVLAASTGPLELLLSGGWLVRDGPWAALALRSAGIDHGFEALMQVHASQKALSAGIDPLIEESTFEHLFRGAAVKARFWSRGETGSIEALFYAEAGDMLDAMGRIAPSDASLRLKLQPCVRFPLQSLCGILVIDSRQGMALLESSQLPAWGLFSEPWRLRYSLDEYSLEMRAVSERLPLLGKAGSLQLKAGGIAARRRNQNSLKIDFDCCLYPASAGRLLDRFGIFMQCAYDAAQQSARESIDTEEESTYSDSHSVPTDESFQSGGSAIGQISLARKQFKAGLYAALDDVSIYIGALLDDEAMRFLRELSLQTGLYWKSGRLSASALFKSAEETFLEFGSARLTLTLSF